MMSEQIARFDRRDMAAQQVDIMPDLEAVEQADADGIRDGRMV